MIYCVSETLQKKISDLPHCPGVYLWKNKSGEIIYIGKAKDLNKRVHNYLNPKSSHKDSNFLLQVNDIEIVETKTESDALILENNLISKYLPLYNVKLMDDSNYPVIIVTNEKDPRIIYSRNYKKYKGDYYGPFPEIENLYGIYKILNRVFPLRKCNTLPKHKCIYYDSHECLGPCINKINNDEYIKIKKYISDFFNGNTQNIISSLTNEEKKYANELDFENANRTKKVIASLKKISNIKTSHVVVGNKKIVDVIGFATLNNSIFIIIYKYTNGVLNEFKRHRIENSINTEDSIHDFIFQFYYKSNILPQKLYIRKGIISDYSDIKQLLNIAIIPTSNGKMFTIIKNCEKNADNFGRQYYMNYISNKNEKPFYELKRKLSISNLSLIHCFDMAFISHGKKTGTMIGITNGKINKKLTRHFNIKGEYRDDVHMMKEVVQRQYKHIVDGKEEVIPNLIIVDGGNTQIAFAYEALKEINMHNIIPIAGLVKDDKHNTKNIIYNSKILPISNSLFNYLSKIQDACHNSAIRFFRKKSGY